ncbi:hypothetical protein BQ8794_320107 [Mesorhizobium prunaredense]|uniref:Uncharacterized protein n=1 Tax=Mesorhizobium prunaredense TaxID=1631249 RepID=A0A1R3VBY0_9HYPH|nr:hypothetical protein BQ8794_320107 [Mesorhizobium prunaredense]
MPSNITPAMLRGPMQILPITIPVAIRPQSNHTFFSTIFYAGLVRKAVAFLYHRFGADRKPVHVTDGTVHCTGNLKKPPYSPLPNHPI